MVSCCPCRKSANKDQIAFQGTQWQLIQFDGRAFDASGDSYTVTFGDDGRLTGKGDCNRLNGGYEVASGGILTINGIASTRMFCPDQDTENRFMSRLQSVTSYVIDGRLLMLFENGDVVMTFSEKK